MTWLLRDISHGSWIIYLPFLFYFIFAEFPCEWSWPGFLKNIQFLHAFIKNKDFVCLEWRLWYIVSSIDLFNAWFCYRSFLCGGSTGIFIYAYCLYYYYARSDMSGFMQTSFFFGYMACICYGFFLMLGTVGFRAALLFVRHIYQSIKCE